MGCHVKHQRRFLLPAFSSLLAIVQLLGVAAIRSGDLSSSSSFSSTAVFALGSFWRAEAVFGCLNGVIRTTAGYTGGSKLNPEYRNVGDHAEAVEIEFDPRLIRYEKLLDIFWSSHDPSQVFGQGPDVGDQYRSAIFYIGQEQKGLAIASKEREEAKQDVGSVTTEIKPAGVFFPAEIEHQKFELRRKQELMHLLGNAASDDEFLRSKLISRLNAYAAGMCPASTKRNIDNIIQNFIKCRSSLHQISYTGYTESKERHIMECGWLSLVQYQLYPVLATPKSH